jgi:hypothetical protein
VVAAVAAAAAGVTAPAAAAAGLAAPVRVVDLGTLGGQVSEATAINDQGGTVALSGHR